MTFSNLSRLAVQGNVDVLVEERVGAADSLFLVQRWDGMFAILRFGYQQRISRRVDWGSSNDDKVEEGVAQAGEALGRVRWFPRDEIANALVTTNVRPLPPSGQLLSFYGACAVSLGLVELEGVGEVERLQKRLCEAKRIISELLPKKRLLGEARAFSHQRSDLRASR